MAERSRSSFVALGEVAAVASIATACLVGAFVVAGFPVAPALHQTCIGLPIGALHQNSRRYWYSSENAW